MGIQRAIIAGWTAVILMLGAFGTPWRADISGASLRLGHSSVFHPPEAPSQDRSGPRLDSLARIDSEGLLMRVLIWTLVAGGAYSLSRTRVSGRAWSHGRSSPSEQSWYVLEPSLRPRTCWVCKEAVERGVPAFHRYQTIGPQVICSRHDPYSDEGWAEIADIVETRRRACET